MMPEKIIQDWLIEIKYNKPVLIKKIYVYDSDEEIIQIMTTNPGILIGKGGQDINRLKERLGDRYKVEIIEADEIICTPYTQIDTRDWNDIIDERIKARFEMLGI